MDPETTLRKATQLRRRSMPFAFNTGILPEMQVKFLTSLMLTPPCTVIESGCHKLPTH
jgi:hypothetical protein